MIKKIKFYKATLLLGLVVIVVSPLVAGAQYYVPQNKKTEQTDKTNQTQEKESFFSRFPRYFLNKKQREQVTENKVQKSAPLAGSSLLRNSQKTKNAFLKKGKDDFKDPMQATWVKQNQMLQANMKAPPLLDEKNNPLGICTAQEKKAFDAIKKNFEKIVQDRNEGLKGADKASEKMAQYIGQAQNANKITQLYIKCSKPG